MAIKIVVKGGRGHIAQAYAEVKNLEKKLNVKVALEIE